MKYKILVCFLLVIIVLGVIVIKSEDEIEPELFCRHFNEELFYNNLAKAVAYETKAPPVAAVFPHNEGIMDMTASVLKTLSTYDYDTVVLLAPNHKALIGKILISGESWETPLGTLEGNEEIKDLICENFGKGIIEEKNVVQEDHSASIVLPYIKEYMPNIKVVTILLNKEMTVNDIYRLSESINRASDKENILLLGSIDFAHYQDYETTVMRDQNTLKLIEEKNIEQLKVLHGEHLDTAESMGVIILYSDARGAKELRVLEKRIVSNLPHTNDYGSYISMMAEVDKTQ